MARRDNITSAHDPGPAGEDSVAASGSGSAARDAGSAARDAGSAARDAGSAARDAGSAAHAAGPAAHAAGPAAHAAGPAAHDSVAELIAEWAGVDPAMDLATVAIVARLGRIRTHIAMRMDEVFAAHGISAADFAAMSILRRRGEVPMRSVADGLYLTAGTVTPRIRRLVDHGLVRVSPDVHDARVRLVALTTLGERTFDAVVPAHLATQRQALESLTAAQRLELAGLLAILLTDLES